MLFSLPSHRSWLSIHLDPPKSKKKRLVSMFECVCICINCMFACVVVLSVCLLSYLAVVLVEHVLVVGEVDHTLDQLQHQSRHHLNVQWLSILV